MTNIILATAGYDHTIKFWDPNQGACLRSIPFNDSQVNSLSITSDKQFIAVGGYSTIKLYEVGTLNNDPLMVYDGHTANVTSIGFQKDSKWLYSASEDGSVRVWDLRAAGFQRIYDAGSIVNTVELHPNQAELISGDEAGSIKIWDLCMNKCRYQLDPFPKEEIGIRSISMAADASSLTAVNSKGNLFIWQINNGEEYIPLKEIKAHEGQYILKVLISPNMKYWATCSSDHSVVIWEAKTNEEESGEFEFQLNKVLFGHNKWVWDCVFTCDSEYLITVSTDTVGKVWNIERGEVEVDLTGHNLGITCVALNDYS